MTPNKPHPGGWDRSLPTEKRAKPAGQWNHYRITADRGRITLEVNGKAVSGGHDITPRKGYIALESEGAPAMFRNLRIRELPSSGALLADEVGATDEGYRSLYTGVDLAGWTEDGSDRTLHASRLANRGRRPRPFTKGALRVGRSRREPRRAHRLAMWRVSGKRAACAKRGDHRRVLRRQHRRRLG